MRKRNIELRDEKHRKLWIYTNITELSHMDSTKTVILLDVFSETVPINAVVDEKTEKKLRNIDCWEVL